MSEKKFEVDFSGEYEIHVNHEELLLFKNILEQHIEEFAFTSQNSVDTKNFAIFLNNQITELLK